MHSITSFLTISIGDETKDSTEIPLLIKDPKEDNCLLLDYASPILCVNYISDNPFFYFPSDKEEPSLTILSPPPQYS